MLSGVAASPCARERASREGRKQALSQEQRTLPKALSAVLSAADKDKDKDKDKDEEINELKRAVRKLQQHNSILEGILNTKQAELARQSS